MNVDPEDRKTVDPEGREKVDPEGRMRIGYVGAVPPIQGGIAQHGGHLVAALRRHGHDVAVETWASQYPQVLYRGGRQRRDGRWPPAGARATLRWWDPLGWLRVGRRLRDRDLLVLPWVTPLQAPALQAVRGAAGVRACFLVHNTSPHERQPLAGPLTRWALSAADHLVVHTATGAAELQQRGVTTRSSVVAMPAHIDVTPAPPPPRPPARLLFFGFIRPYKGLDLLVDAVGDLRRRGLDVTVTIAGKPWGDAIDGLTRAIGAAGLDDVVDLRAGYVADDDVGDLFAVHHVCVLPYTSATQSGVTPVALAAGRPVVVTDTGGLAEQVRHGTDGVVVAPNAGALADGIAQVLGDYDHFRAGASGSATSWDDVAEVVART